MNRLEGLWEIRAISLSDPVPEISSELSELEFSLVVLGRAFARWQVRCMAAAGADDMTPTDILILHHVNQCSTERSLADICSILNIEDTHVVTYSLNMSIRSGLLQKTRYGREVSFATTRKGRDTCLAYREIRESCLLPGFSGTNSENHNIGEGANLLRILSDRYTQAARIAIGGY